MSKGYYYENEKFHWRKTSAIEIRTENQLNKDLTVYS
jgi:hypothetical protein